MENRKNNVKLILGSGYRLDSLVLCKKGSLYLSYFLMGVLEGPRGCKYGFDIFTFEMMMKNKIIEVNGSCERMTVRDRFGNQCEYSSIIIPNTEKYGTYSEQIVSNICKEKGYKFIKRNEAKMFISKLIQNKA